MHRAEGAKPEAALEGITRSIRESLSVRYLHNEIVFMPGFPHTRTGKKLEVLVKRFLQGAKLEKFADRGSVDDPELLEAYTRFVLERQTVSP